VIAFASRGCTPAASWWKIAALNHLLSL